MCKGCIILKKVEKLVEDEHFEYDKLNRAIGYWICECISKSETRCYMCNNCICEYCSSLEGYYGEGYRCDCEVD